LLEALPRLAEPAEIQPDKPRTAWRAKAGR